MPLTARFSPYLMEFLPVVLAGVAQYATVHHGYFKFDDFLHLFQIVNHGFLEFLITPHGGHLLLSSNFVFYVCYRAFGLNATAYMWVALLTHLLNVWLLYRAIHYLTGRPLIAAFGASLWGIAPMAHGSVSWFSAYGHVLATTGVAWLLFDIARLSRRGGALSTWVQVRWYCVILLTANSFGVGLGAAGAFPFVLYLLRPAAPDRMRVALRFASLFFVLPVIYVLQHRIYQEFVGIEIVSPFPVLSPAAITASISMLVDLLAIGTTTLIAGPLLATNGGPVAVGPLAGLSLETLRELSHIVGGIVAASLLFVFFRSEGPTRAKLLGLALLAGGTYGMIALGRAPMSLLMGYDESWMAATPRYHYLAPMVLSAFLCTALASAIGQRSWSPAWGAALVLAWAASMTPLSVAAALSFAPYDLAFRKEHERIMSWIEGAASSRPVGANIYLKNHPVPSIGLGIVPATEFPHTAGLFVITYPSLEVDGRRVFFIESDSSVLAAARRREGSPIARLLVSESFRPGAHPRR
ncbi:MAG: hypothetical protein HRU02_10510 [Myxococcales bacterium]|nr:hypothetical protein [Myxococcales bacterium]